MSDAPTHSDVIPPRFRIEVMPFFLKNIPERLWKYPLTRSCDDDEAIMQVYRLLLRWQTPEYRGSDPMTCSWQVSPVGLDFPGSPDAERNREKRHVYFALRVFAHTRIASQEAIFHSARQQNEGWGVGYRARIVSEVFLVIQATCYYRFQKEHES